MLHFTEIVPIFSHYLAPKSSYTPIFLLVVNSGHAGLELRLHSLRTCLHSVE